MNKNVFSTTSHLEMVLAVQEARIQFLQNRLRRRGPFGHKYLAELPRDSAEYLLCQSLDLLEKGHALCKRTLRQIEGSRDLLKHSSPPLP